MSNLNENVFNNVIEKWFGLDDYNNVDSSKSALQYWQLEHFVSDCVSITIKANDDDKPKESTSDQTIKLLDSMTADERMDVFRKYCTYCGDKNTGCQCMNDE